MSANSDFKPTMLAFLKWFFRTLDRRFTEPLLAGRTLEQAAQEVFDDIAANVRGNRDSDVTLTAADHGAIMDRIAALHIRTRHGEEAVSETAIP